MIFVFCQLWHDPGAKPPEDGNFLEGPFFAVLPLDQNELTVSIGFRAASEFHLSFQEKQKDDFSKSSFFTEKLIYSCFFSFIPFGIFHEARPRRGERRLGEDATWLSPPAVRRDPGLSSAAAGLGRWRMGHLDFEDFGESKEKSWEK